MYKILFPEANNDYIKSAVAELARRDVCEPIAEDLGLQTASAKLADGEVDAMIAGIDFTSRDVILTVRDVIGTPEGRKTFSSLFVAKFPGGRTVILSDGATCKNPTAEQLADIIELTHDAAAKILEEQPRIAVLSFSTFGSGGKDPSMDKTAEAIAMIRERRSDILVDGEMQLDAAVNPRVGEKKAAEHGGSEVAGHANVLIVPDINSGNILYKSIEQFAGATVAGPILLGFVKPVSDLSRGSTVEDIVLTAESLLKLI
jgi:phosphate acetyltransferase